MTITTTQLAGALVDQLVAQGVDVGDPAVMKAAWATNFSDWLGGVDAVPASLASKLSAATNNFQAASLADYDFQNTPANGGPRSDGTYDLSLPDGTTLPMDGRAKLVQSLSKGDPGGINFIFSTTTTDADPGAGTVRFNAPTIAAVTQIFFDMTEAGGADVTAWLDSLDDSTTTSSKGLLYLQASGSSRFAVFSVTAAVVAVSGYRKIPVAYVAGSLPANSDRLAVVFAAGGSRGGSWLFGAGAPGAGLGIDGDSYIDTVAGNFYGPKAAGAWGAATASGLSGFATAAAASAAAAATSATNAQAGSVNVKAQPGPTDFVITDVPGNALIEVTPSKINHPDANAMRAGLATATSQLAAVIPAAPVARPGPTDFVITDLPGNALLEVTPSKINHPDTNAMRSALALVSPAAPIARPGVSEVAVTDPFGNALIQVTTTQINHPEIIAARPKLALIKRPVAAVHANDWMAFDGDSQTAQDYSVSSTLIQRNSHGFGTHFLILSRGKYRTKAGLNFGVGGATTTFVLGRQLTTNIPAMQAVGCIDLTLKLQTNDATQIALGNMSLATSKAQMLQIIQNYLDLGVRLRLSVCSPRSAAAFVTAGCSTGQAAQAVQILANIRRWQRSLQFLEPGRLIVSDSFRYWIDMTSAADDPKPSWATDGTHSATGEAPWWEGYTLWQADQQFGQRQPDLGLSLAGFDATYNPSGNRLPNGRMQGAGGALGSGATGVAPTGATLTRNNANLTAAGSQAAAPAGQNGTVFQLDLAAAGVGGASSIQNAALTWTTASITPGETLEGAVEVSLSNLLNSGGVAYSVSYLDASSAVLLKVQTGELLLHPDQAYTGVWQLDPHTVPATAVSAVVSLQVALDTSLASSVRAQIIGVTLHAPAS